MGRVKEKLDTRGTGIYTLLLLSRLRGYPFPSLPFLFLDSMVDRRKLTCVHALNPKILM